MINILHKVMTDIQEFNLFSNTLPATQLSQAPKACYEWMSSIIILFYAFAIFVTVKRQKTYVSEVMQVFELD